MLGGNKNRPRTRGEPTPVSGPWARRFRLCNAVRKRCAWQSQGLRSARETEEQVGGTRGKEITQTANQRAGQILDEIDREGTNADEEMREARREVDRGSRRAFRIDEGSATRR
jgi:hypothetical protein